MTNIEQFITGAFFIPYVFFLVMCGVPLFFMEASYGQFSSLSPISIWRICPLFKGKYLLDRLFITYTVMYMYINIHVSHPSVSKNALIHLPEEGKTVICVRIHIVFGLLMLPMLITIMHVHTTFVAKYYDKINVKFNLL